MSSSTDPKKATAAADKKAAAEAKAAEEAKAPSEQPVDPAPLEVLAPRLGDMVIFNQMHNGPRLVRCAAIITELHGEQCATLLLLPPGGRTSAEASVARCEDDPDQANAWRPR